MYQQCNYHLFCIQHLLRNLVISNNFFLFSLSLLAIFVIYFFVKDYGFIEHQQNLSVYNKLLIKKKTLLEELESIKSEIELLKNNQYYIEKKLREDMFLIKPNEKIIVFN